jgi:hypothetical protein
MKKNKKTYLLLIAVLAIWGLLGLVTVGVLGAFWAYAASSRKTYTCTQCGEVYKNMEFMDAQHCNVCGAKLPPGLS